MIPFALFVIAGLGLAALTLSKRFELKRKHKGLLLKAISRGDEQARRLYHEALRFYDEGTHKASFVIKKQLPLKAKSYFNKFVAFMKERGEERFGNIRNSRFIKKNEGISEFFKNISEIEKGKGEINDSSHEEFLREAMAYEEGPLAYRVTPDPILAPIPPKPVRKRAPRRKKIQVVEVSDI